MLINYNKCVFCGSKKLKKHNIQSGKPNFYIKAIESDLKISLKKIRVLKCSKCFIIQNNPWFDKTISRKIYSSIYGQHNRNWNNILNYVKLNKKPNHGKLFKILKKSLKIKTYGEYNSPFMGLLIDFFDKTYRKKKKFTKEFFKNLIHYLTSRQLAGASNKVINSSSRKAYKYLKKIKKFKNKKEKIKKYLFAQDMNLSWGQNDNYKSVNSRSLAAEMFNLKEANINDFKSSLKFDLFGIFHSLDHTFEPNKILNFALNNSKVVIIYCHIDKFLNKQHLFSFTKEFLKYLTSKKIYNLDLSHFIKKKFNSPEMYFICSKNKKDIIKFKKNVI